MLKRVVDSLRGRMVTFRRNRLVADARKKSAPVELSKLSAAEWPRSLSDPTAFYFDCFNCFHTTLPRHLVKHRQYFRRSGRGFGEDAFHVMWYLLYREFQFQHFLEIGVFRGQVLSLISLLQKGSDGKVCGISPFLPVGDSVSRYSNRVDYFDDTLANFRAHNLPTPELLKAYSTDQSALEKIASRQWDCIYIDGNHDYEIVSADWAECAAAVKPGGLIVLDDAGLTTSYTPPPFATRGIAGPSQIAQEIDRNSFKEILQVGHNRVFQKISR
jgi:Methyltransferase domain